MYELTLWNISLCWDALVSLDAGGRNLVLSLLDMPHFVDITLFEWKWRSRLGGLEGGRTGREEGG